MADLNAAGGTTFGGLQATATAQLRKWVTTLAWPLTGDQVAAVYPTMRFRVAGWTPPGGIHHAQVQVATDAAFTNVVWSTTLTNVSHDTQTSVQPGSALTEGQSYHWRVRGGDGTNWGPWAAAGPWKVNLAVGHAVEYVALNVGAEYTTKRDAAEYVNLNVGAVFTPEPDVTSVEYVYLNVGSIFAPDGDAVEYAYMDINSLPPWPVIWFLRPTSGREGDGIEVVGWGFGDLQSTYGGQVELDFGGQTGWVPVPVVSWQTFPAQPNAYTDLRKFDSVMGEIDWQHTRIGIIIPEGAVPPGYPLRVRTVTP